MTIINRAPKKSVGKYNYINRNILENIQNCDEIHTVNVRANVY